MSLLSICQQAAQYAGVSAPDSIVGNSEQTAQLLLASANLAGQSLARRPQGGWVTMIREYDFTTQATESYAGTIANVNNQAVVSIQTMATDTDISRVVPFFWVGSGPGIQQNSIVVSITANTVGGVTSYTFTLNLPATDTTGVNFQFGRTDYLLPTDFQRPIDNTFWDRSRFWAMRGPLDPQQWQLYRSSVIGKASIQRRFRFRSASQLYGGAAETYGQQILSIDPVPYDNGSNLVFEYVSNGWCQSANGTPQSAWGADTDTGILDEYLIELDTIWRVLRRLGISYSDEQAEAFLQIDKAVAQDGASAILDFTPNDRLSLIGPWNLPETGYGPIGADGVGGFVIGVSSIS